MENQVKNQDMVSCCSDIHGISIKQAIIGRK